MASLYRPTIIRWTDPKTGKRVSKDTPGAKRKRERSKTWRGRYRGPDGKVLTVTLSDDKDAAEAMLADRVHQAKMEAAGIIKPVDAFEKDRNRELFSHVDDFRDALEAKRRATRHITNTINRIRTVLNGCEFNRLPDIKETRIERFLAELRKVDDLGIASSNAYVTSLKSFGNWLVQNRRVVVNPFQHLSKLNARVDVRRKRRPLSDEEVCQLLQETESSTEVFGGLDGPARAILYRTAVFTGIRAAELASLSVGSLDLEASPPTLTVQAGYSKHRREDLLPLHPDLTAALGQWIRAPRPGVPGAARLWPGGWPKRAAEMIRRDQVTARGKWLDDARGDVPERNRREQSNFLVFKSADGYADFHSLRHTFITNLAKSGVHPKDAKELARHSTITLTMDRYSHVGLADLNAALQSLPGVQALNPASSRGTPVDGKTVANVVAPMVATLTAETNLSQPCSTLPMAAPKTVVTRSPETPEAHDSTSLTTVDHTAGTPPAADFQSARARSLFAVQMSRRLDEADVVRVGEATSQFAD